MYNRRYHIDLVREIANEARSLGYSVDIEKKLGTRHRLLADLVLTKSNRKIVIEVKSSPITLSTIRRLKMLPVDSVIICAPEDAIARTSISVFDYASQTGVRICDINEVFQVLS